MSSNFDHHFSDRNVPFGIASSSTHANAQAVSRLSNTVLFLSELADYGLFKDVSGLPDAIFEQSTLNSFAALPRQVHSDVRATIQSTFRQHGLDGFPPNSKENVSSVTMHLPVEVKDFSDFSCSLFHVQNAGRIMAKSSRAPAAFSYFPIGYQGRAGSIVPSGTDIERPCGHFWAASQPDQAEEPAVKFGPSEKMDYEVEFAAVVGKPLPMRKCLRAVDAEEHIFGFVILNDWSARDIQGFEMPPLGPFNGKSLGTTISPWIVTLDALEPHRVPAPSQSVETSSYLYMPSPTTHGITLEVEIVVGESSSKIGTCPVQSLFWTPAQMVAHSVSSGSALRTGDLLATGTISGDSNGSRGCLLETTEGGRVPVALSDGSQRRFLEDGDLVRITGFAGEESSGVGFGECSGRLISRRRF